MVGDIRASGLSVLSEWYSKPGSNILTWLILLILSDKHNTFALIPFVDVILDMPGIFLYPNPEDVNSIFPTPPLADVELVIYDNLSVCEDV